jgi:CRP-like cAMP-binding protein
MSVVNRLFAGVGEIEVARLTAAEGSKEHTFATDQVVLEQGQPGDSLFLIKTGAVQVTQAVDGQAALELAVLRQGDFFGEAVFFEPGPRGATVKALQPSVLLEVPGDALRDLMARHPAQELSLLRVHTERLRRAHERILSLKLRDAPEAVRLLEARLSAEVRVFDATLKAAHAVFEQTRTRTEEVISNADRARSRFTYICSSIASVFTLAGMAVGGLGMRDVWNVQNAMKTAQGLTTQTANLEQEVRARVESINKQVEAVNKQVESARAITAKSQVDFANYQVLREFREALEEGFPSKAEEHFGQLVDLQWAKDDDNVLKLLYDVEDALTASRDASGVVARPASVAQLSRQDFTVLLDRLAQYAGKPETKAKAYSLLLANSILVDKPVADREQTLTRFRTLLAQHKNERLLSRESWDGLDKRLGQAGGEKRQAFQQVRRFIPQGG